MFHFVFVGRPSPGSRDYGVVGGGYVICYVDKPDEASAERMAREAITAAGWEVERKDQASEVNQDSFPPDSQDGLMITQGAMDGCVLTFSVWHIAP